MKKSLIGFIVFFSIILSSPLFAQKQADKFNSEILSPVEGVWGNRQMLVIDNKTDGDYFYSLDGSDPETVGFAYDGPVLIDMSGDITLRVKKIGKIITETIVKFTVVQTPAYDKSYFDFINSFYDTGLINYTSGSKFTIPSELKYSFGLPPDSFLNGTTVSLSSDNMVSRNIPCVVYDENSGKKWRFIVRTLPQNAGVYSRRDVPFVINDWNVLSIRDENFIYKIDSEYWELPKENKIIDRSVSHMISWQSIDYELGNPIEFFILPPKPELKKETRSDGSIIYSLDGDNSYKLSILDSENSDYEELFTTIGIDTFYGDNAKGTLQLGVFANSVYQGRVSVDYDINKRPPATPVLTPSTENFYSREEVNLDILGEVNSDLFVAVSEPMILKDLSVSYSKNDEAFINVNMKPFEKCEGNRCSVKLEPLGESAVYYKVKAYSSSGINAGNIAEYTVIIDQYNYYYSEKSFVENPDGTAEKPFNKFEQCMEAINKGRNACLRVKGSLIIPDEKVEILSNCTIENDGNAQLVFKSNSSIYVKNSNLGINNCRIITDEKNQYYGSKLMYLFKLDKSVLDLLNTQIAVNMSKNAVLVDSNSSSINILNSIISVSSEVYGSAVSGIKSNLNIQNSSVNITSGTCVAFSINQGNILIKNISSKVTGKKGRIAEFFNVAGSVTMNSFKGELSRVSNSNPIYKDSETINYIEKDNEQYGF